ncbi:MAG TPA: DUF4352 domain-containing protein [Chloroflexota bacterium]|nr:DUF4352 domain-containing protein [Chloroflexota bacterium]
MMQRQRAQRALRRKGHLRAAVQDDEPQEERVALVRWHRIWIGLALIAIAIVWLVVDNALGLSTTTPAPPALQTAPVLGAAQSTDNRLLNAKLVGSYQEVAGRHAPAGERFLVIAVQLVNKSAAPIAVQPRQFIVQGKHMAVPGATYPGQKGTLFARPVAPGVTANGYLLFLTAVTSTPMTLVYVPPPASGLRSVSWRFP